MVRERLSAPVYGTIWVATGNIGNGKNTMAMELIAIMSHYCQHGTENELSKDATGRTVARNDCQACRLHGIRDPGLHVQANFDIDRAWCEAHGITFTRMKDWRDLMMIKKGPWHQLWVIDEPNQWCFDSRDSKSVRNKLVGTKFQMCRHYNADTLFLTQLGSMVDLRGRRLFKRTLWAITPGQTAFQYVWIADGGDTMVPIIIKKTTAKNQLFPFFDSAAVDDEMLEDEMKEAGRE